MLYDYRDTIRNKYSERASRNNNYSLRSFARDLDIPAPRLSDILNHKRGTSVERGKNLAVKLNLNKRETENFLLSIKALHSRSSAIKDLSKKQLLINSREDKKNFLSEDKFSLIANWYHFAILELLTTKNKFFKPSEIARKLGVSTFCAKQALERLARLQLIEIKQDGQIKALTETSFTTNDIPSKAIKLHHEEQLKLAQKALYEQEVTQREIGSATIAINKNQVQELKELVRDFRKKISALADNSKNKDCVYLLGTQLFRLDKEIVDEKK
ncbi:MAG: DUF4423 domain-containing protein [Bdellovibrionales bacterium]|nr:DUF4423 domain-containing protein [Bdellovibrionales bacterium]